MKNAKLHKYPNFEKKILVMFKNKMQKVNE